MSEREPENREIVYPGQYLGENMSTDENCLKKDKKAYSKIRGLARKNPKRAGVIPFSGAYVPKEGDFVVGMVTRDLGSVYFVDLLSPYYGILRSDDRRKPLEVEIGDVVNAKIASVDEVHEPQLIRPWKLEGGVVIEVNPKKVPRIIGKQKSMLNLLRDKSRCKINVGQNGLIWIKGANTQKVIDTIRLIEEQAHTSGLTDRITQRLTEIM